MQATKHAFRDEYVYPETDILINQYGIQDRHALEATVHHLAYKNIIRLATCPQPGCYDLKHLCDIHRALFSHVFAWAGEIRTTDISKGGTLFARVGFIESSAQQIFGQLAKENYLKGLDKTNFITKLTQYYADINVLHPFREGNGRATRVFFWQLAKSAGYLLAYNNMIDQKAIWAAASRASTLGDNVHLQRILSAAVRPLRAVAFEKLARAQALKLYPELQGAFASLDAKLQQFKTSASQNRQVLMANLRKEQQRLLDAGIVPKSPTHAMPALS